MIRKVKASLTIKIFMLVSFLVLAAGLITYAAIVYFLPETYSNRLEQQIDEMAKELAESLGEFWTVEDAGTVIELFEAGYDVSVVILDSFGNCLWPVLEASVIGFESEAADSLVTQVQMSDTAVSVYEAAVEELAETEIGVQEYYQAGDGQEIIFEGREASAVKKYDVVLAGKNKCTMLVSGGMQQVNQALDIIRQIFPYIFAIAVAMAVAAALAASVYLTEPVVDLSRISRRMAALDFEHRYQGKRTDEVGILGQNLNELSANLSETLDGLQKANARLKSDIETEREMERQRIAFFSAASHELKTPVTILKGHLAGMIQKIGDYKNRDYYLIRSLETADKMEGMVQELLMVSRMESRPFATAPADLAEQLRLQLAELTELAEEKDLEYVLEIPEHLTANVNAVMMEKVFRNLIVNAIRYTPEGGNQIRVCLKQENLGQQIYCSIENTGVHIPKEALPHLFEAFYRVEQSRNRQMGGSGLGLYIVKMALEQHGADYGIGNSPDGVKAWFSLNTGKQENFIQNT